MEIFGLQVNAFWISQAIIAIAAIFDLGSFQFKKRIHILYCLCVSTLLISIHFAVLKEWTGAFVSFTACIRIIVCLFSTDKRFMALFYIIACTGFYFTYKTPVDFFALISALLFSTYPFQACEKKLRKIAMMGSSTWLIYNCFIFSPAMVMLEIAFLISNFIGYQRFYGILTKKS